MRSFDGYRSFILSDVMTLTRYLLPFAMESDEALPLVDATLAWIRQHELIAPPILTLERLVWRVQRIARQRIYSRLTQALSPLQKQALDDLLVVDVTKGNRTPLAWLRIPAKKPSPESMYHLLERIIWLSNLQLPAPANMHPGRLRQLASRGRRYRAQPLAQLENPLERYSLLVAYLNEWQQELIDQLIDMFDRWFSDLMRKGRNKQRHYLHRNITLLNRDLNTLAQAMAAFLEAKEQEVDPFEAVFAVVDERALVETVASATAHTRPADMDFRDLVENTFIRRRKAMLAMMRTLSFQSVIDSHSALEALEHVLLLLDEHGKRVRAVETVINNQVLVAPLEHLKRNHQPGIIRRFLSRL